MNRTCPDVAHLESSDCRLATDVPLREELQNDEEDDEDDEDEKRNQEEDEEDDDDDDDDDEGNSDGYSE